MPRPYKARKFSRKRAKSTSRAVAIRKARARKALVKRMKRRSPIGGFPKSKLVRLRYCQSINLDAGTGVIAKSNFVANGMYDPWRGGTGHQPSNFDRWMGIYNHFTVIGSKITVQYTPSTATAVLPCHMGVVLSDNGTLTSEVGSVENLLEQPRLARMNKVIGIQTAQYPSKITKTFSAKKFFGKPLSSIIGDGTYRGNSSGDPTELAYYEVFVASVAGNNPGLVQLMCTIDYIAVLTEPELTDYS